MKLFWHHSGVSREFGSQFKLINDWHRLRWDYESSLGRWGAYHFLIDTDGALRQYRAVDEPGPHTKGHNDDLGACFAMDGMTEKPHERQMDTAKNLIRILRDRHGIRIRKEDNRFHRDVRPTLCPGIMMDREEFLQELYPSKNRKILAVIRKLLSRGKNRLAMMLIRRFV